MSNFKNLDQEEIKKRTRAVCEKATEGDGELMNVIIACIGPEIGSGREMLL